RARGGDRAGNEGVSASAVMEVSDNPLAKMPLNFEVNQGQTDKQAQFLSRGQDYTMFLTANGPVLSLRLSPPGSTAIFPEGVMMPFSIGLSGANPMAAALGINQLAAKSNSFIGNDPTQGHVGIDNYSEVHYQDIYPGIDLAYHGHQGSLQFDFLVAPGANPGVISLDFAQSPLTAPPTLTADGQLVLSLQGGTINLSAPVVYQVVDGVRKTVTGTYVLQNSGNVGFSIGAYDQTRPLIIDPVVVYATLLGGSGTDDANGLAVDGLGNAYVTGRAASTNFPTQNPFQSTNNGSDDVIVAKLNATGTALLYSTYMGGTGGDIGR